MASVGRDTPRLARKGAPSEANAPEPQLKQHARRAPESSSELSGELGMLVARTRRIVLAKAGACLASVGESLLAWQILVRLVRAGAVSQRDLAEAIAQHPAGVSRLIDELEARHLVERERDTEDRRKQHVMVTEAGRRRFDEVYPKAVEAVDEAMEVLTLAERRQLRALLRKIVDANEASSRRRG